MAESKGTSKLISLEICIFALWWCKQNAYSLQCFVGPSSIQLNSNEKIADLVPWAPLYVYIIGNEIQVVTRYMKKYEAFFDKYGNIMNNYEQQQPHGCGIWCTTVLSVFAQSWSITVSPDPTCEKEQLIVHRMLCCCCWAEENTPLYFHNTLYILCICTTICCYWYCTPSRVEPAFFLPSKLSATQPWMMHLFALVLCSIIHSNMCDFHYFHLIATWQSWYDVPLR